MFRAWPKIPRLENEVYHITEKIDGTNAAIVIQPLPHISEGKEPTYPEPISVFYTETADAYGIWAQSRTRLITPEDDNFGFARWVQENAEQLIKDLGIGYHYGEWWGQGINRGYGLDHKRFSLFNPTKHSDICYHVPYMVTVENYRELQDWINVECERLVEEGSLASLGYMRPEGLVVYAEKAKTYWKVIVDK